MSNELRSIVSRFDSLAAAGQLPVLATVIDVRGSSYRLPGARMLIDAEGNTQGTVSGGCLEADLLERAQRVRETAAAEVFTYDTSINDDSVFALNMGCRGVVRILLEPAGPHLFEFLHHRVNSRHGGVVATLVRSGSDGGDGPRAATRLMFDERGFSPHNLNAAVLNALAPDCVAAFENKTSRLKVYDFGEVFFEYIAPPVPLVVFGAGHDAVPLIWFGKELGWHITLVDHRPGAATRNELSVADEIIVAHPLAAASCVSIDGQTVVVLMTHNYSLDLQLLEFLLRSPARYLGLLGPRTRANQLLQDLSSLGIEPTDQELERVYAPIGVDIGAETPEEIALSIIAEIQAVVADRPAGMLRNRNGSIHTRIDNSESLAVAEVAARSLVKS
jgi:xanthine/CO dehydrogenase XdhC/CoxF family maturation factor